MSEETPKPKKSLKSKLIKWLVVILAIIIGLPIVLSIIISSSIKVGGSTVLSSMTKGETTIGGAYLNLLTGRLLLEDIVIKNPKETFDGKKTDFAHDSFFKLGKLDVELQISSVMSDEIVVKKVYIDAPEVTYEKSLFASSNLDVILKNLNGDKETPKKEEKKEEEAESASNKKVVIEDLVINDTKVNLASMGMTAPLTLPDIHLTNLGKPGQALTIADAIKTTFTSLFTGIFDSAKQVGVSMFNSSKDAGNAAIESGKAKGQELLNSGKAQGDALLNRGKDALKKLNPFSK